MAAIGNMSNIAGLVAGHKANATTANAISPLDEDDSSLSSTASDIFDRLPSNKRASSGSWEVDANGNWHRYGSLESATSTGISSICSSTAADDVLKDRSSGPSSSKKRMSDGTIKVALPSSRISSGSAGTLRSIEQRGISTEQNGNLKPQQKRRGRPPKDKTTVQLPKPRHRTASFISTMQGEVKPRSAIPYTLPISIFASQCIEAAHASRLDPYVLHAGEHALLADRITSAEVTVYLNVRNAILRLWTQNPRCCVTVEEAAGCAKEGRFYGLTEVAYKWLTRNGYINFGCVEVPQNPTTSAKPKKALKQKTVVVIGAGVAGLTTARQLEGLFAQHSDHWLERDEKPPKVVILEARKRIGGRVYSKPLRMQKPHGLAGDLRNTAEMGAMIVTGFEHGNPLDPVIRGQLGLQYHLMTDALTIYDTNGKPVKEKRDMLNTELYTDITDRTGEFRAMAQPRNMLKGDEDLIKRSRDPMQGGYNSFKLEPLPEPLGGKPKTVMKRGRRLNAPPGTEKLTGKAQVVEASTGTAKAAQAAAEMGWKVKEGISKHHTVSLKLIAEATLYPTLGAVMDNAITQYQSLLEMTSLDMRLLNWHHANLEYANAAPVSWLSLSGHDQDTGNEFEGAHSEIIGGYTQLPRGLMNLPTKLDVKFQSIVDSIHYDDYLEDDSLRTRIVCTDGEVIDADEIVVTAPLGVLKSEAIDFDPPLPHWKMGAIDRMGFGLLNKVVLVYNEPFWDESRDMFGLLNEAEHADSLNPSHYERQRGRFYLIWNASKTSGRPVLIALMAGHAAHQAEVTDTSTLVNEVTDRLRRVFSPSVPLPQEVIVTRWKQDPFTRGTYSFVAPRTQPQDYDLMAKSVGNLHFAGEATCGTHPATVHGAFLSGLRAAADVMEGLVGPIKLPSPLVGPPTIKQETSTGHFARAAPTPTPVSRPQTSLATHRSTLTTLPSTEPQIKQEPFTTPLHSIPAAALPTIPRKSVCAADRSFWIPDTFDSHLTYETCILSLIGSKIGDRPTKPLRPGVNPFLLFTKAHWDECREFCNKDPKLRDVRNIIRTTLGTRWKALSEAEKVPWVEQSVGAQGEADRARREWEAGVRRWDEEAKRIREEFMKERPPPEGFSGELGGESGKRKTNVSACVGLGM
nr:hypothetical protein B0A51_09709 [Rachicladosporium sp. CCFEE 5018]